MRFALPALLVLLLAAPVLSGCGDEQPATPARDIPFREDGRLWFERDGETITEIAIEIAETDSAITRGLMERRSMPSASGMLFLMPRTQVQSFWMTNTPLSLDITFVSADSVVLNTAKYTTPYSPNSLTSDGPARFVVETVAGFTDRHGIQPGDRIRWTRGTP